MLTATAHGGTPSTSLVGMSTNPNYADPIFVISLLGSAGGPLLGFASLMVTSESLSGLMFSAGLGLFIIGGVGWLVWMALSTVLTGLRELRRELDQLKASAEPR